jgi:hypothetical protein
VTVAGSGWRNFEPCERGGIVAAFLMHTEPLCGVLGQETTCPHAKARNAPNFTASKKSFVEVENDRDVGITKAGAAEGPGAAATSIKAA